MNKQELINHIKDQNEWLGNHRFILIKKEELISMIEDLDEPQKVKVPKCVAGYIVRCHSEGLTLWEVFKTIRGMPEKVWEWLKDEEHQAVFSKAYTDGYEVEEEPRWIVCYSTMYLKSPLETGQIDSVEITPKKELAYHFKSYKEAKQQTSLIGGAVEQVDV